MEFWHQKHQAVLQTTVPWNPQLLQLLARMAHRDFPHLLVHGPPGVGKLSLIYHFLSLVFRQPLQPKTPSKTPSSTQTKTKEAVRQFCLHSMLPTVSVMDCQFEPQHKHSKQIIEWIDQNFASCQSAVSPDEMKIVILHGAALSGDAQMALRRVMERAADSVRCRFILSVTDPSSLHPALKSRCLPLRVPCPSPKVLQDTLLCLSQLEKKPRKSDSQLTLILEECKFQPKKAMIVWEATHSAVPTLTTQPVQALWEQILLRLIDAKISADHGSPLSWLTQAQEKWQQLLGAGVPSPVVARFLLLALLKKKLLSPSQMHRAAVYAYQLLAQPLPWSSHDAHIDAFLSSV